MKIRRATQAATIKVLGDGEDAGLHAAQRADAPPVAGDPR